MEPQDARYALELSNLRIEAIPRLRHAGLKVQSAWKEAKRIHDVSADDALAFEHWWTEKNNHITQLSNEIKMLSQAIGLSPNGMGWTAP